VYIVSFFVSSFFLRIALGWGLIRGIELMLR
jgi:hypothetical protein